MEQLTIRNASAGDVPRLIELLEAGALVDGKEDPSDVEAYRAALIEIKGSADNDILVADLNGEVVGMCQLVVFRHLQRHGGRCAEIESMHVHPTQRSKGIGERLLVAAMESAQQAGCYRVQLTSNLQRSGAHRFYERMGFDPSHVGFKRLIEDS